MTHEEQSRQTKEMLAAALKTRMAEKPISKITVSELIADCDINRKTFYYHFADVYALLKWMLDEEAIEVVKQFDLLVDYRDAIVFVMNYMDKNKHILNCAIDSMGRAELKRFFIADFHAIVRSAIDGEAARQGFDTPESFKRFLTVLYTEAMAGGLMEWINTKETTDRGQVEDYLTLVLQTTVVSALRAEWETRQKGNGNAASYKKEIKQR